MPVLLRDWARISFISAVSKRLPLASTASARSMKSCSPELSWLIWYEQRPFQPCKRYGLALLLQNEADFPINSRWTGEQSYSDVLIWSSLGDKTLNISRPSPACSIVDKKVRSLLIFLLIRVWRRAGPIDQFDSFHRLSGLKHETGSRFTLDCLDHPVTTIPVFNERARIGAHDYRRIALP